VTSKRAFITGGASGLGRALAERYAAAGWRVCIGDVHEPRAAETVAALRRRGVEAQYLRCDVTREEDLTAAAEWLSRNWGGVDLVVNNAGVAVTGAIDEVSLADWSWIVDINLLGVVRGCKVFTPLLKQQGGGRIVNIASLAGLLHPPMTAAYCATKAAVVALSETMKLELQPHHIGVSVVCPAFFRTNLTETMRAGSPHLERITRKLVERASMGAPEIADRVYRAVERGDFYVLTHHDSKLIWLLKRLAPETLYLWLMAYNFRRMAAAGTAPAAAAAKVVA
jgi:NAD(P)-dependent dehydrogenase (short-subunit alcohol dehydrogenase family)